MAELHLVTGYKGTPHITSADQGLFNAGCMGTGDYVLATGKRFEAQIINSNTVRIFDGSLIMNGRFVALDSGLYLNTTIPNGKQGENRHDVIFVRYEKNQNGIESVGLEVSVGTSTTGTPSDPSNEFDDSILTKATFHDMPLYRVILEGLTIVRVEPLFQMLAPVADIQRGFYKNLLINGDFQCNQRGNKTYAASGDVMYTVDMWRAYGITVKVLNEGVTLTGTGGIGYFTQFIQLGELKTTTYTISAMVDGKVCTFTVTPGGASKEKDFGKFKISALTTSTWDNDLGDYNNKLKVSIHTVDKNSITVKYVDVFEGVVAYPHVKEDPATALVRCRRYIQRNVGVAPILEETTESTSTSKYVFGLWFEAMAKVPTLVACSWRYRTNALTYASGTEENLEVKATVDAGVIEYIMKTGNTIKSSAACGVRVNYIMSCEHNPEGD